MSIAGRLATVHRNQATSISVLRGSTPRDIQVEILPEPKQEES